jgi:hypothetical protein
VSSVIAAEAWPSIRCTACGTARATDRISPASAPLPEARMRDLSSSGDTRKSVARRRGRFEPQSEPSPKCGSHAAAETSEGAARR